MAIFDESKSLMQRQGHDVSMICCLPLTMWRIWWLWTLMQGRTGTSRESHFQVRQASRSVCSAIFQGIRRSLVVIA